LKNLTNRKLKSVEALHYKNLIESAADPKERWRSLNTIIGFNNVRGSSLYLQDGKHLLSKPKEVATKFNRFFATIGTKVASQLSHVPSDA